MQRRSLVYYVPLFLVGYFALATTRWALGEQELYLISPWAMFQHVYSYYDVYDVEVTGTLAGPLPEPVSLRERGNRLGRWLDGEGMLAVRALFKLHWSHHPDREFRARFQRTLERRYLEPGWSYRLVRRRHFSRDDAARSKHRGDEALGPYVASAEPAAGAPACFDFGRVRGETREERDPRERHEKRRQRG